MGCDWVKVRAPGSVMLFGEHAVLAQKPAMVTAIAQTLQITLSKREDAVIDIQSNTFEPYQTTVKDLRVLKPYTFILACLKQHPPNLTQGLNIHIDSEIDPTVGFGSSAAITVAMLKALQSLFDLDIDIWQESCTVIQQIQGYGSGMDALASLHGGTLYYDPKTQESFSLTPRTDLHLLYCGYKTPTGTVLQQVRTTFANTPALLKNIYQRIGKIVQKAKTAWEQNDTSLLAQCMCKHQELQKNLHVSDAHSEKLCQWLEESVRVAAVKISGSGLGDCLLALGGDWSRVAETEIRALHPSARYFPLITNPTGASLVE